MESWNVHITTYPLPVGMKVVVYFFRPGQKALDIRRAHKRVEIHTRAITRIDPNTWLNELLLELAGRI